LFSGRRGCRTTQLRRPHEDSGQAPIFYRLPATQSGRTPFRADSGVEDVKFQSCFREAERIDMGRLVRVPQRANDDLPIAGLEGVLEPASTNREAVPPDSYMERIAKYVPGEVLAFFIFINAILEQSVRTGGKTATMAGVPVTTVAQGAFVVGLVLTPLFISYVREEGDAWITNAFVSTLAFPFWAYALGAVAFEEHWDGNLAAILLATFTVLSGLIAPRARRRKRSPEKPSKPARPERPQLDLVGPRPA
jgi:hypothetical protein